MEKTLGNKKLGTVSGLEDGYANMDKVTQLWMERASQSKTSLLHYSELKESLKLS